MPVIQKLYSKYIELQYIFLSPDLELSFFYIKTCYKSSVRSGSRQTHRGYSVSVVSDHELTEGQVYWMNTFPLVSLCYCFQLFPLLWSQSSIGIFSSTFRSQSSESQGFLGRKTTCASNLMKGIGKGKENRSMGRLFIMAWITVLLLGPPPRTSKHYLLSWLFFEKH